MSKASTTSTIHLDSTHPIVCAIASQGTPRELLFAPEGAAPAAGGGGSPPSAASAPSGASSTPAGDSSSSSSSSGSTSSGGDAPARKAGDPSAGPGLAADRPDKSKLEKRLSHAERKELKKSAASELYDRLSKGREQPQEGAEGDKATSAPKGDERSAESAQRGSDGRFAGKASDKPAADDKPAAAAPHAAPQAEPPKRDVGETEQRLSRTVRALTDKTSEAEGYKRQLGEAQGKLAEAERLLERGKQNPLELLAHYGMTLEDVARGVVEKKYATPAQIAKLPPEVQAELTRLKGVADRFEQAELERRQADERRAEQEQRTRDTGSIKQYLQANAAKYPIASSIGWTAGVVLDETLASKQTDALPFLARFESSMLETVAGLLGNDAALDALLKSKPAIEQKLRAKYASTSNGANPAASNGAGKGSDSPRSVSSLPSGNSAPPSTKLTKEQRKREAVRALHENRRE
jgi:hypothetical protein